MHAKPRPRKLVWITLALGVATAGLALRWASPALSPPEATHVPVWFDVVFGVLGACGMAWAARRLWSGHRRDLRAVGFSLICWAALAAGVTVRQALFAQADYERGRLAFFVAGTLLLAALGVVLWWRSAEKDRTTENTEKYRDTLVTGNWKRGSADNDFGRERHGGRTD
jgi:hypothetical protein